MSYADNAALARDEDFAGRVSACIVIEAQTRNFPSDQLARYAVTQPVGAANLFLPLLSTAPGFAEQFAEHGQEGITDGEILSAVQSNWDTVSTVVWPQTQGANPDG